MSLSIISRHWLGRRRRGEDTHGHGHDHEDDKANDDIMYALRWGGLGYGVLISFECFTLFLSSDVRKFLGAGCRTVGIAIWMRWMDS